MSKKVVGNASPDKKLTLVPPLIGLVLVLIISLVFPEPGMIGITILLSVLISVSPYATWKYFRIKKINGMEQQLPNFLRDLVEAKKSGLTLTQALREASKNEYGMLNEEVNKMSKQLSWNMSFDEVLENFAKRNRDSTMIGRTVKMIMEAKRSGGKVISAMETVSSDVSTIIEVNEKRKSDMAQHSAVLYLIYFMFLAITIILSKFLVPMTEELADGELMIGEGGGQICTAPMQTSENVICSFFESFAGILGLGTEGLYYQGLFLSMVLIQGIFTGLMIGQVRNNSPSAGIKHSLIMAGSGLIIYIIAARYIPIEIM